MIYDAERTLKSFVLCKGGKGVGAGPPARGEGGPAGSMSRTAAQNQQLWLLENFSSNLQQISHNLFTISTN